MARNAPASWVRRKTYGMVAIATLLISACGGAGVASPAASAPDASASDGVVPTTSPTPGESLGARALAALADPTATLRATIEATLNGATSKGTYEQSGRDFHVVLVTTHEDITFTTEQIVARDQAYLLIPGRPWLRDPVVSGANRAPTLSEALDSTDAVTPAGTASIDGITVEQYDLDGLDVSDAAASLGLTDPGASATATSSALLVSPDGKPFALDLKFTVPSSNGTPFISDYRLTFGWGGDPISITMPADAWVDKADGHGYDMWYPATWEADLDPSTGDFTDSFIAPDAEVIVFCRPDARLDLEEWVADGYAFYSERFGASRMPPATRPSEAFRLAH